MAVMAMSGERPTISDSPSETRELYHDALMEAFYCSVLRSEHRYDDIGFQMRVVGPLIYPEYFDPNELPRIREGQADSYQPVPIDKYRGVLEPALREAVNIGAVSPFAATEVRRALGWLSVSELSEQAAILPFVPRPHTEAMPTLSVLADVIPLHAHAS